MPFASTVGDGRVARAPCDRAAAERILRRVVRDRRELRLTARRRVHVRRRDDDARHRRLLDGDRRDPRLAVHARRDLRRSERDAGHDARAGDRRDARVLDGPEDVRPGDDARPLG